MNKTHFSKEYFVFLLKTERTRGSLIKSYLSNVAAEVGMTADGSEVSDQRVAADFVTKLPHWLHYFCHCFLCNNTHLTGVS